MSSDGWGWAPSRRRLELGLRPAERCEPSRRFTGDQRLQPRVYQRRFFLNTRQTLGFFDKPVIEV